RREGRAAQHGAEGEPGRPEGVRPADLRQADRRASARGAPYAATPRRGLPPLGPGDRRAEDEVILKLALRARRQLLCPLPLWERAALTHQHSRVGEGYPSPSNPR